MINQYMVGNNLATEKLATKIRSGSDPDNPMLIKIWLEHYQMADLPIEQFRAIHHQQFSLLLETVIDELVPNHWRKTCLDHIYLPLSSLRKLVTDEQSQAQLNSLFNELVICTSYVEKSLSNAQ